MPQVPVASDALVLPSRKPRSAKSLRYRIKRSTGVRPGTCNCFSELRVIARTSSFSFRGKEVDIAEIARKLNVAHLLEGSVRRSGDTLRITAQLIRTSDSSQLWSHTYDRRITDVFKVRDEIAAAVVSELKVKLFGSAPKAKKVDPKAYALFLHARAI